jgi:hypothetical protein
MSTSPNGRSNNPFLNLDVPSGLPGGLTNSSLSERRRRRSMSCPSCGATRSSIQSISQDAQQRHIQYVHVYGGQFTTARESQSFQSSGQSCLLPSTCSLTHKTIILDIISREQVQIPPRRRSSTRDSRDDHNNPFWN